MLTPIIFLSYFSRPRGSVVTGTLLERRSSHSSLLPIHTSHYNLLVHLTTSYLYISLLPFRISHSQLPTRIFHYFLLVHLNTSYSYVTLLLTLTSQHFLFVNFTFSCSYILTRTFHCFSLIFYLNTCYSNVSLLVYLTNCYSYVSLLPIRTSHYFLLVRLTTSYF